MLARYGERWMSLMRVGRGLAVICVVDVSRLSM